jgi:hypothetical protein
MQNKAEDEHSVVLPVFRLRACFQRLSTDVHMAELDNIGDGEFFVYEFRLEQVFFWLRGLDWSSNINVMVNNRLRVVDVHVQ